MLLLMMFPKKVFENVLTFWRKSRRKFRFSIIVLVGAIDDVANEELKI
jgi:hypothetical protein